METLKRKFLAAAAIPTVATLLLAGCSSSTAVSESDLETQTAEELQAMAGEGAPLPTIDCPDDLDAEVGVTMDCVLSVDGEPDQYQVTLTVTSVDGTDVGWDIQVAETPM
ncbi:DUF4333 domain-containing protein [Ruania alba]|uniref:DUF4333 domain-containing protein n=1 Tax=Ruania alba TaxID=648782 RepID=A0A1H5LH64_9MICO|nr:DUF4333 domain-containing protein [Ruania alba]SEE75731.1 protein of unknown function [Ruania alba]